MNCSTQEIPLWQGLQDEVAGLSPFPATASKKPEWIEQIHIHRFEMHWRVSPISPLQHPAPCISSTLHPQPKSPKKLTPCTISAEHHTHSHLTNTLRCVSHTMDFEGCPASMLNPIRPSVFLMLVSSNSLASPAHNLSTYVCMYVCIFITHTLFHTRNSQKWSFRGEWDVLK